MELPPVDVLNPGTAVVGVVPEVDEEDGELEGSRNGLQELDLKAPVELEESQKELQEGGET